MLVLASASPRRAALLTKGGYVFKTIKASVQEDLPEGILPRLGAKQLALRKAKAGSAKWQESGGDPEDVVLGADTIVALGSRCLGKPASPKEAVEMLKELSGKTHSVFTGVALVTGSGKLLSEVVETVVHFRALGMDEIQAYVAGGDPLDKAGAYGIQGEAKKFVQGIQGDITNVIGLPMEYLSKQLETWGIEQTNIALREVEDGLPSFEGLTGGVSAP